MKTLTDWDKLTDLKDKEIDFSDIAKTNIDFWENAVLIKPQKKVEITVSLDEDIAEWVESFGVKSNQILNDIFRAFYTISSEKMINKM